MNSHRFLEQLRIQLAQEVESAFPAVVHTRRIIHQHPELGFEEHRTSKLVASELKDLGLSVQHGIAKTGVVALLEGDQNDSGKTLLLRADMDALPLHEETDLPFKSKIPGKMHACGHDAHVAMMLGVARVLTSLTPHINGMIKFVFQPAEESSGGALPMIQEGIMENPAVTAALAAHVHHEIPTGKISLKKGYVTASADGFRIQLEGPGGHGSAPHQAKDLVVIGLQICNALVSLPSREIDPLEPVVLTIGKLHAGTRYNIIPDSLVMEGTIRTFNDEVRAYLKKRVNEVVESISILHGVSSTVQFNIGHSGYKPGWNDPRFTKFVGAVVEETLGKNSLTWARRPFMGAEDFFEFSMNKTIPTCMIFVGTRNEKKGCIYPLHSSRFKLDEDSMRVGMQALSAVALAYLK